MNGKILDSLSGKCLVICSDLFSGEAVIRQAIYGQTRRILSTGSAFEIAAVSVGTEVCRKIPRIINEARIRKILLLCKESPESLGIPSGFFWWDYYDGSRALTYSVCENDFPADTDIEKLFSDKIASPEVIPAVSPDDLKRCSHNEDDERKKTTCSLLLAESALSFSGNTDAPEIIGGLWLEYWNSREKDDDAGVGRILGVIDGFKLSSAYTQPDFIIDRDNIRINAFKLCEDRSGDYIIRAEETEGRQTKCSIVLNKINAGFYADFMPREEISFRIDSEGYVREVGLGEI